MKVTTRQHIAAVVLLAVFLPMLLLSSFHVHPEAHHDDERCEECVHHVPHSGHFSSPSVCSFDCVLCQFLTLPFLVASTVVLTSTRFVHVAPSCAVRQNVVAGMGGVVFGRAPPVFGVFTGEK